MHLSLSKPNYRADSPRISLRKETRSGNECHPRSRQNLRETCYLSSVKIERVISQGDLRYRDSDSYGYILT